MNKRAWLVAVSVLPWGVALAGLGWLLIQRFPPSGIVTFDVSPDGRSAWVDPFLPAERVSRPGLQPEGWYGQRVIQDPVYSAARLPGIYDEVEVGMEFRALRQPLVEFGLLRDSASMSFEFVPIWLAELQGAEWSAADSGGKRGYVKKGTYPSSLTAMEYGSLGIWHASATALARMDPAGTAKKTTLSLRGAHDFYVIPSGGRVFFQFDIQDVNRASGPDTVVFRVYRGSEELSREAVGIGGSRDKGMGPVIKKVIELPQAQPGVYRIQVISDDDVFIRSMTTESQHWVVGPRVAFGDDVGFGTSTRPGIAWTDSRHTVLETFHREGLQRVDLGSASVQVTRTHEPFRLDRTDQATDKQVLETQPQKLTAPNGDIRVIGDGWFSFTPEAFFAPQPRRVTDSSQLINEGINTVITSYTRPETLADGWMRTRVTFKLNDSANHLRFALSAPGLLTRTGAVDIRRITLSYRRPPLSWGQWWPLVRQELASVWRRLQ